MEPDKEARAKRLREQIEKQLTAMEPDRENATNSEGATPNNSPRVPESPLEFIYRRMHELSEDFDDH